VELPTYTNIWRIEKRLYKLYDFRLPMPLPVGQIAVFTAITVPYVVLLTVFGLPFSHSLFWLYVLPPGVLTWLATRPVLESKRLPELLISQARYLGEPSTWCRMTPLSEKDEIVVFGWVWRRAQAIVLEPIGDQSAAPARAVQPVAGQARLPIAAAPAQQAAASVELARARRAGALPGSHAPGVPEPAGHPGLAQADAPLGYPAAARDPGSAGPVPAWGAGAAPIGYPEATRDPARAGPQRARGTEPAGSPGVTRDPGRTGPQRARSAEPAGSRGVTPDPAAAGPVPAWGAAVPVGYPEAARDPAAAAWGTAVPVGYPEAARDPAAAAWGTAVPVGYPDVARDPGAAARGTAVPPGHPEAARDPGAASRQAARGAEPGGQPHADASGVPAPAPRAMPSVLLVRAQRSVAGPPPARPAPQRQAPGVEQVLSGPGDQRAADWRNHVTVAPGGRGPGRPDHEKEARARAVLPFDGPRLIVVLGCTVGAGQTVTTLMLADLLADLRGEPVAALDLNPGPASLSELARVPATTVSTVLATRSPGAHAAHPGQPAHAAHPDQPGHAAHPGRPGGAARGPRGRGRLDVICQDAAATASGAMTSLEHGRLIDVLAGRYPLTLADPGASAVAKVLAVADQLVLVAPASADAAPAVSMTREWLGAHGHAALAANSIALVNGVSRRSVQHAEQTELVLRRRCRAIVRVPWDDHLAEPETERGIRDSLEPGEQSRLGRLHPAVLQAYTALAGVLVNTLAADPPRRRAAR
jgi:MinD-like ATPase involved in chromosome partitioning or flagellar assembly